MAAPDFRKVVRDTFKAALSAETDGFNAQLAAIASDYDVNPFSIDWATNSENFIQSYIAPEKVDVSGLIKFPGAVLYTSRGVDDNKGPKGTRWGGQILAHFDVYLRFRALDDPQWDGNQIPESADTESMADAVDVSVVAAVRAASSNFQTAGLILAGINSSREPVQQFGDGYGQRLAFTFGINLGVT